MSPLTQNEIIINIFCWISQKTYTVVPWTKRVWTVQVHLLTCEDFPGGSDGKESACKAEDPGSIPGSGRSLGGGNGNPLQYSCLENSMNKASWWATWGPCKSVGSKDWLTFMFFAFWNRVQTVWWVTGKSFISNFGSANLFLRIYHTYTSTLFQSHI